MFYQEERGINVWNAGGHKIPGITLEDQEFCMVKMERFTASIFFWEASGDFSQEILY